MGVSYALSAHEQEAAQSLKETLLGLAEGDALVALEIACRVALLGLRPVSSGYVRAVPPKG